jgi:hypothetical protein
METKQTKRNQPNKYRSKQSNGMNRLRYFVFFTNGFLRIVIDHGFVPIINHLVLGRIEQGKPMEWKGNGI